MRSADGSTARFLWAPPVAALAIGLLSLTPRVQESEVLTRSFWGAAGLILAWAAALALGTRGRAHTGRVEVLFRPQHWVQALCQLAVFVYWGWYWRPVYDMTVLIGAQIVFAYAFSMLLSWSRGTPYRLGFGPVPIIFSINLFLWFRDDWFYLQFLMIGIGFLGKELIRWERDGRSVHIFNPSAFALGLFSLVLIATGSTDLTWGQEIASTLTLAPRIYLYLFLVGLVVMYFFSITLVAGGAAATLFGLSAAYSAWAGVPYFVDSEIPAAVFLGLHLLVTDPSTSPRGGLGKLMFGIAYGVGVFTLYAVLGAFGAPTFYDKLLCVPLLNLSVRAIEHLAASMRSRPFAPGWSARRLNLSHMAVWIGFFVVMSAAGRTDGMHPGDSVPFWEQACADGRRNACDRLLQIERSYCGDNAAWACNELGRHHMAGAVAEFDAALGRQYFARACELRFQPGCLNLLDPERPLATDPRPLDLRLMLREGGRNLMDASETQLLERACTHAWSFACDRIGRTS